MRTPAPYAVCLAVLMAQSAFPAEVPRSQPENPPSVGMSVLTRVSQIRNLSGAEAERALPLALRGTVLLATPSGFFIHDGECGIWVDFGAADKRGLWQQGSAPSGKIRQGVVVELDGVTDPGGYAPQIVPSRIRIVGSGELPLPESCGMERLLSGIEDSQWLVLEGVVQDAAATPGARELILVLAVDGQWCRLAVQSPEAIDAAKLVDARVRVRGVFSAKTNLRGELAGLQMYVGGSGDIEILTPAPDDPFSAPRVTLGRLLPFAPTAAPNHRKVTRGTVTFVFPGRFFFLQDGSEGARVEYAETQVNVGADVEVAGFINSSHTLAGMSGALVRALGESTLPGAESLTARRILRPPLKSQWTGQALEDANGRRVSVKGTLLRAETPGDTGISVLKIESEGEIFSAFLPGSVSPLDARNWVPGAEVELTGVCELDFEQPSMTSSVIPVSGFMLWISSPTHVKVLRMPPWWTPERLWFLLGTMLAILAGVLFWVWLMHREVARRGLRLAGEIAAGTEAKLKHETAMRERTRLAHDLHDTLEQGLTGLSLQLQAAELFHRSEPERSRNHLELARRFLDRSREDVHRTVWDLHRFGLDDKTLVGLLRETAERMSNGGSVAIQIDVSGEEMPLPEVIAGNLLLLAQEAVTNALKHAGSGAIVIGIEFGDGLVLRVIDDGPGFDPSQVPGHLQGHFGLQGMHERAKRIGAVMTIDSSPGNGCAIQVVLSSECLDFPSGD